MNNKDISFLYNKIKVTLKKKDGKLPSNCYFLDKENVLALPNPYGDSRHPYTRDGMTLWAYSSGYISVNETNFYIIPITLEGKEPYLAFFGGILNKKGTYDYFSISGVSDTEFGKEKVEKYVVFTPTSAIYLRVVNKLIFAFVIQLKSNFILLFFIVFKQFTSSLILLLNLFLLISFIKLFFSFQLYKSKE